MAAIAGQGHKAGSRSAARRPFGPRGALVAVLLAGYILVLLVVTRQSADPVTLGLAAAREGASGSWVVKEVKPTSKANDKGIRPGDVLVSVDGAPPPDDVTRGEEAIRTATQVEVRRPGTGQLLVAGDLGRGPRAPNRMAFFFIATIFFAVGAAALMWGRGAAPFALALVCCAGAVALANAPAAYRQVRWALLLNGVVVPLFTGGFAYLFLIFPVGREGRLGRWRLPATAVLLPALPLAALWIVTVAFAPGQHTAVTRWPGYLYFLGCLAGGSAALIWSWWSAQGQREQAQLRIVAVGSLFAVLPFLLLSLLPEALSGRQLVPAEVGVLPLVLLPAAFGYAILRYQLMDLHLYIRRGLVYSALAVVITGVYWLAVFAATFLVHERAGVGNVIALATLAGIIVAIFGQRLRDLLQRHVDRLFERRRYDYRQQLLEFSQRLSGVLDPDELAQSTVELIGQTLGTGHVRLYLYEPAARCYHLWASVGPAPAPERQVLRPHHPLVEDVEGAGGAIVQRFDVPADAVAVIVPVRNKGQAVALLTLGPKQVDLPYSSEDLALLHTVANQLAVATENTQLYGRMRDLYLSGIRTLAATVDAKDAYTHGHSARVAAYSRALALALGLRQLEVETIELAGLLHDIGKIGVPDAVLQKPARLCPDERAMMMEHTEFGATILADNPALLPLVPLVRHHHEWYNGSGYPDGLRGEAIPLGAAIIAVADTFDTMTTDRPYRRAPGWDQARAEIARYGGTQFHPRVVAAFLRATESDKWLTQPAQRAAVGGADAYPLSGRITTVDTHAMSIVYKVAQMIGEVTELAPFIVRVIDLLRREMGTGGLDIFLVDEATGELCSQARPAEMPESLEGLRIPPGRGIIGWVAARQAPARVDDCRADPRVLRVDGWDGRSELAAPLVSEGRTIGVINVESRRVGAFTEEDEALLMIVAQQLAQVIEVARLHDALKRNALVDGLTGVANHRHFYERLEAELDRAGRAGTPLSLVLIDVDGLKSINDGYGHLAGDAALRALAGIVQRESRGGDLVARYGGDEFAVILPGLERGDAARYVERLLRALRGASFEPHPGGRPLPLPSISCGVASYGADGERAVALVAVADERMYGEKSTRPVARRQVVPTAAFEFDLDPRPPDRRLAADGGRRRSDREAGAPPVALQGDK